MLADKKKYVNGLYLNIYLTKDNILIPINLRENRKLCKGKSYISKHNYNEIKKINSGTKVKTNYILNLEEITNLDNIKYLILNLESNNESIIRETKKIIDKNKNIEFFLTANDSSILEKLLEHKDNYKVGIIVNDIEDLNYSTDFYIINNNNIDYKVIEKKINSGEMIFINNINSKKDLITLNNINCNLNIISKHPNSITNSF
ncbi:MAG: hypothetical protein PUD59_05575 [bacterium]|nr:hypothetical protein [bacterium]